MSVDTMGDFLTVVRNAIARSKRSVDFPYSQLVHQVAELLKREGYVRDCAIEQKEGAARDTLRVFLKYVDGESVIHEIDRVSTPGRRVYEGVTSMRHVAGGLGVAVVTTSSGLMTDKEARQRGVGGEVLCVVW